jgi:hypothetical protein
MALTPDDLAARSDDFDRVVLSRDRELAAEVLAEDFALVLVHPEPAVVPRSAWIEMLPDYVVHEWEVQEQKIEVRKDLGTVLQRIRMEATVLGQDRSGPFVVSDLWVPVDGVWRVWRRHSTPLTAGRMPGSDG